LNYNGKTNFDAETKDLKFDKVAHKFDAATSTMYPQVHEFLDTRGCNFDSEEHMIKPYVTVTNADTISSLVDNELWKCEWFATMPAVKERLKIFLEGASDLFALSVVVGVYASGSKRLQAIVEKKKHSKASCVFSALGKSNLRNIFTFLGAGCDFDANLEFDENGDAK